LASNIGGSGAYAIQVNSLERSLSTVLGGTPAGAAYARRRRRGRRAADRVVQRMPAPGRTRPGRAGPATWRRDRRSRLARQAGVLAVREPAGRHDGERDQAAVIDRRDSVGTR